MSAFSLDRRERIAVVVFDQPGQAVNTLTTQVGEEMLELLEHLRGDDTVDAVVLASEKKDAFIAGGIAKFLRTYGNRIQRDLNSYLIQTDFQQARVIFIHDNHFGRFARQHDSREAVLASAKHAK